MANWCLGTLHVLLAVLPLSRSTPLTTQKDSLERRLPKQSLNLTGTLDTRGEDGEELLERASIDRMPLLSCCTSPRLTGPLFSLDLPFGLPPYMPALNRAPYPGPSHHLHFMLLCLILPRVSPVAQGESRPSRGSRRCSLDTPVQPSTRTSIPGHLLDEQL